MSNPSFMDPERYLHRSCGMVVARECEGPVCEACLSELREAFAGMMDALKRLFTLAHELEETGED